LSVALFVGALGLLLAAEGLVYAAFPARVREALTALLALPDDRLRALGFVAAAFGLLLLGVASLLA
jgi:uncharacterized protein YjeT (DUF2065 family)